MNKQFKEYTFRDDLKKRLKDPVFKKAWEESEVEYNIMAADKLRGHADRRR